MQNVPGMEHTKQLSDVLYQRWAEGSKCVLKHAVEKIYSTVPPRHESGSRFYLAGFHDFRALMIIPAVVDYIVKGRNDLVVAADQRGEQDPQDEFTELRERYPKFSTDLAIKMLELTTQQ